MEQMNGDTSQLQLWLQLHRDGDPTAKDEIIARSCQRLRILAQKIMRSQYSRLSRWEQTDDVLQTAVIRLHRTLATVQPDSVAGLLALGAQQIRWTLLDLIRSHYGPQGAASNHDTAAHLSDGQNPINRVASEDAEPDTLEEWTAFHEAIEQLPEDERQAFSLTYYEGLSQAELAALFGVTDRTIRRRLTAAKVQLGEALRGDRQ